MKTEEAVGLVTESIDEANFAEVVGQRVELLASNAKVCGSVVPLRQRGGLLMVSFYGESHRFVQKLFKCIVGVVCYYSCY